MKQIKAFTLYCNKLWLFHSCNCISVLDFGAIGNGTGQSDEAFQNALNKAGSMKGGIGY